MSKLTLSFDNGPDPEVTPRVLDLLADRGIRAHFFVLGRQVATERGRRLVERARDEGHLIGNHSYTHEVPLGVDPRPEAVQAEIAATEEVLGPLELGAKRFRPFGGGGVLGRHLLSRGAVDYLLAHDYSCVLWSSVPRDWEDQRGWPARALADCAAQPHTVLVLHDVANACLEGLATFLDQARDRDLQLSLDLPPSCVPIAGGRVLWDMHELVADGGAS